MKMQWMAIFAIMVLISCNSKTNNDMAPTETPADKVFPKVGSVEILDDSLKTLITENELEVLAGGFNWSEGPLWIEEMNALIFSDVPENKIYKWTAQDSVSIYLEPSGYTGEKERGGEMGSNGLTFTKDGKLALAQHGNRAIAQMDSSLMDPQAKFSFLADSYKGKKFNSPNDLIFSKDGTLFFTDPPYGLEGYVDDPLKELDFYGVFMKKAGGEVQLIDDKVTRPNGIALSNDESKLYVASSDPDKAILMEYTLDKDFKVLNSKVFADVTSMVGKLKGLPDGLKVHSSGNIFTTGPGGVLIFTPEGKHLGTILTGQATSNCAFDTNENYLYMTADDYLMRIKLNKN